MLICTITQVKKFSYNIQSYCYCLRTMVTCYPIIVVTQGNSHLIVPVLLFGLISLYYCSTSAQIFANIIKHMCASHSWQHLSGHQAQGTYWGEQLLCQTSNLKICPNGTHIFLKKIKLPSLIAQLTQLTVHEKMLSISAMAAGGVGWGICGGRLWPIR